MLFPKLFKRSSKKNGIISVFRFFGSPKVVVNSFEQAGDYLIHVWKNAISHIPKSNTIESILMLGLGGGCSVPVIHKKFPHAHLTIIEWDEEMIAIAKELNAFPKTCLYNIIHGDACEEIQKIHRTFDLILVDLFTGGATEPRLADEEMIHSLLKTLAPNGLLILNLFKTFSLVAAFQKQFHLCKTWRDKHNTLAMFQHDNPRLPLLFITNPKNSDPKEDRFLAQWLQSFFDVTVVDPKKATEQLPFFPFCLIRNAWPSDLFEQEFKQMRKVVIDKNIKSYNPFHRAGFVEDKTYLIDLYRAGFPVIPCIDSLADLDQLPVANTYLIKPKNGCSSRGIKIVSRKNLQHKTLHHHLIQPVVSFTNECSFYFVDGNFVYALASANRHARWNLHEFIPTKTDIAFAKQFIDWNALPYGLERIDTCRLSNGSMLLMEVESEMPMLCLHLLSDKTRKHVLQTLLESMQRAFNVSP